MFCRVLAKQILLPDNEFDFIQRQLLILQGIFLHASRACNMLTVASTRTVLTLYPTPDDICQKLVCNGCMCPEAMGVGGKKTQILCEKNRVI